ncbi:Dolichyl-P-Man:Man(7)GlcNAc(2)-PP-dolichol alpha-1,6-mannosyltransferase [Purpureocillium takamizusanense]|uniref:Mannosyltransferase n=1 Tax=Purpureocillium takamizusanense TaxID=2060973 RepID=A0A9Q8Q9X7_9HYPO|nr:Dolichyl-P-Man:Man(7)GlcNAc(2)-PP-dolichol alpha-1,6-mannosyltransferase [Purpureocillium takamizusanense]UNI15106.1 Dolichyl-P-Man:Man(7)GlcNAc(2)-PP-dolichol alpha-1,6-mannosyltransferase [Purpureocillium takamizusanense]
MASSSSSSSLADTLLEALLFLVPLAHLAAAPHTKVEESFNMQAAHDILVYGIPWTGPAPRARLAAVYDHASFPGAVPRTFVGAVVLAGLAQPLVALAGFARAQLLVRALLAAFNAAALVAFARALRRAHGVRVARWWSALLLAQFHLPFYASRALPNMFAFGLVTLAMAFLLPGRAPRAALVRRRQAVALLVVAAAVFRAELAILLAAVLAQLLYSGQMTPRRLVPVFAVAFVAALAVSIPIDSFFWQRPLWPELWGFYYNAVLGSSSNWGTSPWHYYFTSALPRLLLNPLALPLIALALFLPATAPSTRRLVLPSLAFVAVYSLQPHKEARFIFYVVPPLTAAAALAADYIAIRRRKSPLYAVATAALVLSVLASLAATAGMLLLSSLNYPGGDALAQLYALTADAAATMLSSPSTSITSPPAITVHADVLTCMTGLTLFGQNRAGLPLALTGPHAPDDHDHQRDPIYLFDKTEDKPDLKWPSFWKRMDYALMEDPMLPLGNWKVLGVVQGYDGIELLKPGAKDPSDVEAAAPTPGPRQSHRVLGLGARVADVRRAVRKYTGGWWIGPRMSPRIHIMKRVKDGQYATS